MFWFGSRNASGREPLGRRVATVTVSALMLLGVSATMVGTAAPASADATDGNTNFSGDGSGGLQASVSGQGSDRNTDTPATQVGKKPDPKSGGVVTGTPRVNPDLVENTPVVFEAWFNERDRSEVFPSPLGSWVVNYDWVNSTYCQATSADDGFGYNGNAIPLPPRGSSGPAYLVWDAFYANVKVFVRYTDYTEVFTDPETGETFTDTSLGSTYVTWKRYEYNAGCKTQTAPTQTERTCATYIEGKIDGPYDQSWTAMKPTNEGGTNNRTPNAPADNSIGVDGPWFKGPSTPLGVDMQNTGRDPRSAPPRRTEVWNDCLPDKANTFAVEDNSELIGALGRYVTTMNTWYTSVWYYKFATEEWPRVYPAVYAAAQSGGGESNYNLISGNAFQITEVTAPWKKRTYDYWGLICKNGTAPGGVVDEFFVEKGSTRNRDAVAYPDASPTYYTWNCGDPPGTTTETTDNDFLQCDTYTQTTLGPSYPQLETRGFTYTRVQVGTTPGSCNYLPGCGSICIYCTGGAPIYENRKNPCPTGFSDNGSYCYRVKTPQELGYDDHGVIPESNGQDVYYSLYDPGMKVDGKRAAPLKGAYLLIDDVQTPLEVTDGVYQLPTTADPVHFEWERIRINTNDGANINDSGKNVVWEYNYKLAPWSSPMLKNTDVNALTQPYHGWTDSTPETVEAAEMSLDTKWEPDKFYEYKTVPYSYTHKNYTYTDDTYRTPYTYHGEWRFAGYQDNVCQWWSGYQKVMCLKQDHYDLVQVKDAPPAGCVDKLDGAYTCPKQTRDPCPAGYTDTSIDCIIKNPAPAGYTDNGNGGYTSNDLINDTGHSGGIAFDEWRKWPATSGQEECVIDMGNYNPVLSGQTYKVWCGDNVTENTRAAYFRFFQSSTAGSQGWQVTPWARVTADVQTSYTAICKWRPTREGTTELIGCDVQNKWRRQTYECPAQSVTVNVTRTVS